MEVFNSPEPVVADAVAALKGIPTKVDLKGNEYYAKIHEQLAKKYGVDKVTAAQLGGLECGKCHY